MAEALKDVGEFRLIRRIHDLLKREGGVPPADLTVGIGDDAAAYKPKPGHEVLITSDSFVEGRHYLPRYVRPRDVGRRAMVANVSDIGAMGGVPRYALISLGLKDETLLGDVEEIYRGFLEVLNPFGATVIGGNVTGTQNDVFIDITLIGEVKEGKAVRRSTARPGDAILVTGFPGRAAAGLQLLFRSLVPVENPLATAYIKPCHRAKAGASVAATGHASSMIDTSDGFLGDLGHICEESGAGAELFKKRFPVAEDLQYAAELLKRDPLEFFLGASDDYELIITCAGDHVSLIRSAVARACEGPVSEVGRITTKAGKVELVMNDGSRKALTLKGWNHFR
ncbi:MAG: thiamine-phosphate kinase [Deltaproteobacteria bacterium]|nr:thiamine-phosphate kinase [Deltaproteobacteria bacterium]